MDLNPKYLSFTLASQGKGNKKRAAGEPKKKKTSSSSASQSPAKKGRVEAVSTAPTSATTSAIPTPASVKGKEVDSSGPVHPPLPIPPNIPRPSHFKRGQLWDGDVSEELGTAFFPPRRFLRPQPLEDADRLEVQNVPRSLAKALGLSQAYLHLHGFYVLVSEEARNLKLSLERSDEKIKILEEAKDTAEAEKETLKMDLQDLRTSSQKTTEELVATRQKALADLLQANSNLDKAQTQLAEVQTSYSQSMAAVKSLQEQRSKLWSELEEARVAIAKGEAAYEEAADVIREAASDSFEMALAQIEYLNPGVKLNLTGYGCRSRFEEGVLIPPPPSPEAESASLAGDDQAGGVGEETATGVEPEGNATKPDGAAP